MQTNNLQRLLHSPDIHRSKHGSHASTPDACRGSCAVCTSSSSAKHSLLRISYVGLFCMGKQCMRMSGCLSEPSDTLCIWSCRSEADKGGHEGRVSAAARRLFSHPCCTGRAASHSQFTCKGRSGGGRRATIASSPDVFLYSLPDKMDTNLAPRTSFAEGNCSGAIKA